VIFRGKTEAVTKVSSSNFRSALKLDTKILEKLCIERKIMKYLIGIISAIVLYGCDNTSQKIDVAITKGNLEEKKLTSSVENNTEPQSKIAPDAPQQQLDFIDSYKKFSVVKGDEIGTRKAAEQQEKFEEFISSIIEIDSWSCMVQDSQKHPLEQGRFATTCYFSDPENQNTAEMPLSTIVVTNKRYFKDDVLKVSGKVTLKGSLNFPKLVAFLPQGDELSLKYEELKK
jgi:hypothetical protein